MSDCLTDEAEKEVEILNEEEEEEEQRWLVDELSRRIEMEKLFGSFQMENLSHELSRRIEMKKLFGSFQMENLAHELSRRIEMEKLFGSFQMENLSRNIEFAYGAQNLIADDLPQENILLPQPEALEQGKKAMVNNRITTSEKKYKTAPITLSQGAIEAQYGKTMTEAAAALEDVSSEKIFQENILLPQPEALEQGKKAMVKNCITASEKKYKTAPITLSHEAIEAQYGKTMKEAAQALEVSLSTLKRKCRDFGISGWQGPSQTNRKVNNSSNQSAKNGEYDGAVQDFPAINKNENTLTIKAKYKEDTIKFHLSISEATLIIVEENIGKKFNLTHGTYKLNYLDEDEDWILLASDDDMSDCMKSSRILGQNVVRLLVLPISG